MNAPSSLTKNNRNLPPETFLATVGKGGKVVTFLKEQTIYRQGDAVGPIFYIREGKIRYAAVSEFGKEATLGILSEGAFFGDGGLAGQLLRTGSAAAMTDCKLLQIDKETMTLALRQEPAFSDLFIEHLLARNIRYQKDLANQLFRSSEKRLAQALLLRSRFGEEGTPVTVIPNVSHESLADMAGTTPSRVSFFMDRFRRLGFLAYSSSGLRIRHSLLNLVLHD